MIILILDREYTDFELAILIVMIASIAANIFIFQKLNRSFSIKYELIRNPLFRHSKCLSMCVQIMYRINLLLPALLLIALFIQILTRKLIGNAFVVLVNGILILCIANFTNISIFYYKLLGILIFTIASELTVMFLLPFDPSFYYVCISCVFFSLNGILVGLTVWSREHIYWDFREVFPLMPQKVETVNKLWITEGVPKEFMGGLYGWFSKDSQKLTTLLLYVSSMVVLIVYSFLIWFFNDNYLGAIAAGAILTYDILIFVLTSMSEKTRSPKSIMFLIILVRFILFVFGQKYWFAGYCLLYVLLGGFIGHLIIEKRFPKTHNPPKAEVVNALKTPEFMLVIMTAELICMIVGLDLSPANLTNDFVIGDQTWPFWLLGVASIIVNFVVFFYMASLRVLFRKVNRIRDLVSYYFGFVFLTEYHIFLLITYCLIVLLGAYFYLGLKSMVGLLICLFVPLIYMSIAGMAVYWQNNDYYILADIDQHNKEMKKRFQIEENTKKIMLKNQQSRKRSKNAKKSTILALRNLTKQQEENKQSPAIKLNEDSDHGLIGEDRKTGSERGVEVTRGVVEVTPIDGSSPNGYEELVNWRDPQNNIGFPKLLAYITFNDKRLLIAMTIFLLLLIGFSVATKVVTNSQVGLHLTISILSFILQMSYYRCCKTHHQIEAQQIVGIVAGYLLGLIYWSVNWGIPQGSIPWAVIMVLILVSLLIETLQKKLGKVLYAMQITQILLSLIFICIVISVDLSIAYLALTGAIIFYFIVIVGAYYIYKRNNDSAPKWLIYTIFGIVFLSVVSVMIVGFISDAISDFLGFSVTMLAFIGIGLIYSTYQFYSRYINRYQVPMIFSAYGLPVFKFDSTTETLKRSETFVYIHYASLIGLVVYAQLTFLIFGQIHVAVIVLCFFEIAGFYSLGQMLTSNYHTIGEHKKELTQRIYEQTFDMVKDKYLSEETQGKSSGDLRQQMEALQQQVQQNPSDEIYDNIIHLHDRLIIDQSQQEKFLYFWMALIEFRIYSDQKNEMLKLIYMVQQIKEELEEAGIVFASIEQESLLELRYEKLKSEIASLPPEKFIIYEHLVELQWQNKKAKDEADMKIHEQEEKKNLERQLDLGDKISKVETQPQNMIDKFKALLKKVRKGYFKDEEFPGEDEIFGTYGKFVDHLESFGDRKKLIKGDINMSDVRQGCLGDCYLISALGVLGHNWICRALGMQYELNDQRYTQQWQNAKGAYMVRFQKFSKDIYVIVDDRLPVDGSGNIVFGRSEDEDETWVSIIEKAYAKLYGGYYKINGGKCHLVMAELTGGFPSEILLKDYERNLNGIWNQLMSAHNNKYLLAAGSPGGAGSDTKASKKGIVQGHAYSIIEVREVEDYRLIKLKNPHGSCGQEWKGDWSDESSQMTKRMMGLLKHTQTRDGVFWMALEDFIIEFKSLYICRIFNSSWKSFEMKGQWTEENSMGRPELKDIEKNPQFGIKVHSKCTVFISVTQDREDSIHGRNHIGFRVQKNDGRRMHSNDISTEKLCSPSRKLINSITLSSEVNLEADSYPYTFTMMIFTKDKGDTGSYSVQIYSSDKDTEIIDDKNFLR